MINEAKARRIAAFGIFAITLGFYIKTLPPTVTFWDCGEYIACCHQLLVPHPPGNPLFILLGRVAAMVPLGIADKDFNLNLFCALLAALSNMLAFLLVTRFVKHFYGELKNWLDVIILYSSGILGVTVFAFSATYWQNATETEVYMALNLLMVLAAWLMLVWYDNRHRGKYNNLLLILVVYLISVAIGVHQTTLIFIPALFILLFYEDKHSLVILLFFGLLVWINKRPLMFVFEYILLWLPKIEGKTDTFQSLLSGAGLNVSTWFVMNFVLLGGMFGYEKFMQSKGHQPLVDTKILGISAVLFAIGLATHLYIPYRSLLNPGIDENDPENVENFVGYLMRKQYGETKFLERQAPWGTQFGWYGTYFSWQFLNNDRLAELLPKFSGNFAKVIFYTVLIFLALYGMVTHMVKDSKRGSFFLGLFLIASVGFIAVMNHKVEEVRFRDYVWLNSYVLFGMYVGMGCGELLRQVKDKWYKLAPTATVLSAFCLIPFITQYKSHNYTNDYIAFNYAFNMLNSCEPNSLLFTNGDNDTFPLWWMQESYGLRKDVRLMNLSLLNTDWYIKQLKNREPKVPFSWSDKEISQLSVKVYDTKSERFLDYSSNMPRTVVMESETMPRIYYLADLAAANMLVTNNWKKPVYYAVTVSDNMGFDDHKEYTIADILERKTGFKGTIEMRGLANKLLPIKAEGELFNSTETDLLLNKVFEWGGILKADGKHDSTTFKDYNSFRLMINYLAGFNRLAVEYATKGNELQKAGLSDSAMVYYNKAADQMIKAMQIRNDMEALVESAISICRTAQRYDDALQIIRDKLVKDPESLNWLTYEAIILKDKGATSEAEEKLKGLRIKFPDERDVVYTLSLLYQETGRAAESIQLWNEWVGQHPEDTQARGHLNRLKDELEAPPPTDSAPGDAQ